MDDLSSLTSRELKGELRKSEEKYRQLCDKRDELNQKAKLLREERDMLNDEKKKLIEEMTGKPVITFSYPNGDYDEEVKRLVRETGYRCAAAIAGEKGRQAPDLFALERTGLAEGATLGSVELETVLRLTVAIQQMRGLLFQRQGAACAGANDRYSRFGVRRHVFDIVPV